MDVTPPEQPKSDISSDIAKTAPVFCIVQYAARVATGGWSAIAFPMIFGVVVFMLYLAVSLPLDEIASDFPDDNNESATSSQKDTDS